MHIVLDVYIKCDTIRVDNCGTLQFRGFANIGSADDILGKKNRTSCE